MYNVFVAKNVYFTGLQSGAACDDYGDVSPECRTLCGSLNIMFWSIGVATIAPIAYVLRNWRDIQIAISVPCLVAIPLYL